MTPTTLPLRMRRNDDPLRLRFNITDGGVPVDMSSGYSAKLQVRDHAGDTGTPAFEANSASSSGTRIALSAGGFDLIIYRSSLSTSPVGSLPAESVELAYDILITTPAGDTNAWYVGTFTLEQGVTIA